MPTYTITANSDDGQVECDSTVYATASAGTGTKVLNNTATVFTLGQIKNGVNYQCFESFVNFDTSSIPTTEIVVGATLHLTVVSNQGVGANQIDVRSKAWTSPLTTAQYLSATAYRALPLTGLAVPNGMTRVSSDLAVGQISKGAGATSRFVMTTSRTAAATAPVGNEYITFASSEAGVTAPTLVVNTVVPSTMVSVARANVQLSTGETVVVQSNGTATPTWTLGYYAKGSTAFTAISVLMTNVAPPMQANSCMSEVSVAVDASDNLYVVGISSANTNSLYAQGFKKTVGSLAWTAKTALTGALTFANAGIYTLSCDWVATIFNSTGGLFVSVFNGIDTRATPANNTSYATLSCTNLLAGTGTLISQQLANPTWLSNPSGDGISHTDVKSWAERPGYVCVVTQNTDPVNGSNFRAGTVVLASGGGTAGQVIGTTGLITSFPVVNLGAQSRIRIVPIDVSQWALLICKNNALLTIYVFDQNSNNTAQYSLSTGGGYVLPDFSDKSSWTAIYNPVDKNIWVYYIDASNEQQLVRLSFSMVSYTWSASAVLISSTVGAVGSTNQVIRAPRTIVDERYMTISAANNATGTLSTISTLDTFNVSPDAPQLISVPSYDAGFSTVLQWVFSDPNPKDVQVKYEVEIDNNSTSASAYRSGIVTNGVSALILPAATLANNITWRWRVRTYDVLNATGTWSAYSTFTTTSTGSVAITDPAIDNQTGINTSSYTVLWTYANSGGPSQQSYSINVVRLSDSAVLKTVSATTSVASAVITGLPTDTPLRFDLTVTNTSAQTTPVFSRLFTTSYSKPNQITVINVTPISAVGMNVSWILPAPTGNNPTTDTVDIWRSVDGQVTWTLIGTVSSGITSFNDYIVPDGITPVYILRSNASTGYIWSSPSIPGSVFDIDGLIISELDTTHPESPWNTNTPLIFGGPANVEAISVASTTLQFAGRSYPVTEFGNFGVQSLSVKMTIPFTGNPIIDINDLYTNITQDGTVLLSKLRKIVNNRATVCIRDNRSRRIFGTISGLSITDKDLGFDIAFTVDTIDYVEGITTTMIG